MMGIKGSSCFLWLSAQPRMNYVHISVELLSFSSRLWSTKDKSCQGCHETFRGQSCKPEQDPLAGSVSSFACNSSFYVVRHTRHELPGICSRPWGWQVVLSVGSNAHIFKSDLLPDKSRAHSELTQEINVPSSSPFPGLLNHLSLAFMWPFTFSLLFSVVGREE